MAETEINFLKSLVALVAHEEGVSPRTVLKGTGLTGQTMDELGNGIDLRLIMRTYDRIAELSTQPGLGFRSPSVNLGDQGLLGAAILMAGTVDDALSNLQQYGDVLNVLVRYEVMRDADRYIVRTLPKLRPSLRAYQLMTEENLAIWKCASLPLADLERYLEEIWIDYPAPEHWQMYEALFPRCRVSFGKPYFQAILKETAAEQVLPMSNPAALEQIENLCKDVIERMTPSTSNRVRAYLADSQPNGWSVLQIASALRTTEKTLGRRLNAEGVKAKDLISEHRYSQALNSLDKSGTPEEAATQAGYADVDAFRKAFKRWSGMTVKQYQSQVL